MSEHYTLNTKSVKTWCSVCRKSTMHRVDHKRIGSCLEHEREGMSKAQQKLREKLEEAEKQPTLEGL